MKITDINTFVGPYPYPTRYRTPQGLMEYLDDYRIESAVAYHSAGQIAPWIYNAELTQMARQSQGRIRACHVLDPMLCERSLPGEGTLLQRLRTLQPEAVRLMPNTQKYPLNAFFCDNILGALNELGLPLILDAAEAPGFEDIPVLCNDYPNLPFIIARRYFNCTRSLSPLLEKLDNLYIDMSIIIDTGYLEELVQNRCGSGKLLFGSGMPLFEPSGSLAMILYSTIGEPDKANILGANWDRLEGGVRYDHQG